MVSFVCDEHRSRKKGCCSKCGKCRCCDPTPSCADPTEHILPGHLGPRFRRNRQSNVFAEHRSNRKGCCTDCGGCRCCDPAPTCANPTDHIMPGGQGRRKRVAKRKRENAPREASRVVQYAEPSSSSSDEDSYEVSDDEEESLERALEAAFAARVDAGSSTSDQQHQADEGAQKMPATNSAEKKKKSSKGAGHSASSNVGKERTAREKVQALFEILQLSEASYQPMKKNGFSVEDIRDPTSKKYESARRVYMTALKAFEKLICPEDPALLREMMLNRTKKVEHSRLEDNTLLLSLAGNNESSMVAQSLLAGSYKQERLNGLLAECHPNVTVTSKRRRRLGGTMFTQRRKTLKALQKGEEMPKKTYSYRVNKETIDGAMKFLRGQLKIKYGAKFPPRSIDFHGHVFENIPVYRRHRDRTYDQLFADYKESCEREGEGSPAGFPCFREVYLVLTSKVLGAAADRQDLLEKRIARLNEAEREADDADDVDDAINAAVQEAPT